MNFLLREELMFSNASFGSWLFGNNSFSPTPEKFAAGRGKNELTG